MNSQPNPELVAYLHSILLTPMCDLKPKLVTAHDLVTTMVLHRSHNFQAELVILHPSDKVWNGEHRHPNVDSIEVDLYDCCGLTRNGKVVETPDFVLCGKPCVWLKPTDFHGITQKLSGDSLLSVQMWLNGVRPTSVGFDWEGAPVSDGHKQQWEKRSSEFTFSCLCGQKYTSRSVGDCIFCGRPLAPQKIV